MVSDIKLKAQIFGLEESEMNEIHNENNLQTISQMGEKEIIQAQAELLNILPSSFKKRF